MSLKFTTCLVFFVNGRKIVDNNVDPEWTLLEYLRNKLRLCGTKLGCGEGGCGACTVMVSKYDNATREIRHFSVNACLAPVCSMHGMAVTTVEGIGSTRTKLHAVQERIAKSHGSQCGFCTPGIVMSMYTLIRNNSKPNMDDIDTYMQGNLCRCTGYRPILEGFKTFTEEFATKPLGCCMNGGCIKSEHGDDMQTCCRTTRTDAQGSSCCQNAKSEFVCNEVNITREEKKALLEDLLNEVNINDKHTIATIEQNNNSFATIDEDNKIKALNFASFSPYDPSQEPIFPCELQLNPELDTEFLMFQGKRMVWYRPTSIQQLIDLKSENPEAKIVVGNTELGIEMKFKNCEYPCMIQSTFVKELNSVTYAEDGISFGASVTLNKLDEVCKEQIKAKPGWKTRIFAAIIEMLQWFAGKQIRNVASIGGNIMTGSPISDLNPIFMAARCLLVLISKSGSREITFDKSFFTGYRRNVVSPDELLVSITIPFTEESEYVFAYKQARRRHDDIAIVNAAFRVKLDKYTITDASMSFGGMAPTTISAVKTAKALVGRTWNGAVVVDGGALLIEELPLDAGAPGGMIRYRHSLVLSFFYKFYLRVTQILFEADNGIRPLSEIPKEYESATQFFGKKIIKSHQLFEVNLRNIPIEKAVGKPIPHASSSKQACGEAVYCDDIPRLENELYLALVISSKASANILNIDFQEALGMEGVVDFICHHDLTPERNKTGITPILDEEVFASTRVYCIGQIIGAIVAKDQGKARRAAKKVRVAYEDLPAVITIEDAIAANSQLPNSDFQIVQGNPEEVFEECHHHLVGQVKTGAQEHFYLETNAVIAIPKGEFDEMEIISSNQNLTKTQMMAAKALGVPANKIVCRIKRIGGGFGGKETRSCLISTVVAVAAQKVNKPVRIMLDRDEDMVITGWRHPILANYKVGFNDDGKIKALDVDLYNNAGWSIDLSLATMKRSMLHADNAYMIPAMRLKGTCCKTNLPSNTAFRGFGAPQAMMVTEILMNDIAVKLGMDPAEIREKNLYKDADVTHYNNVLTDCTVKRCWSECIKQSCYYDEKKKTDEFNQENRWKKRGIAIVPTKFGIGFVQQFLNQGGALINIYTDGSVLLTHGGVEMGQGLHTKMIQVASTALKIAPSKIHITETATDKIPNTSPSSASACSDIYGMAVLNACLEINKRLEPYKAANPRECWEVWVKAAYMDRVSLSATGFYQMDVGYNFETNTGIASSYYSYGVGCSVVEIDCLTGDHQLLKTDIVMDVGESLNPAIDIGQIEGAFMQGYGFFVMEQMIHSPSGNLLTRGPGTYKIPGFGDIPEEFNVSLLRNSPNSCAIFSSKAVGEPPLFLASSVYFAIKSAITSARKNVGLDGFFQLDIPATAERIRMACEDEFTQKVPLIEEGTYTPWGIQSLEALIPERDWISFHRKYFTFEKNEEPNILRRKLKVSFS